MKNSRWITRFLPILFIFAIAGCVNQEDTSIVSELIPSDAIEQVDISYAYAAEITEWELEQDKIGDFKSWAMALSLEHKTFEEGNSPGDRDGGGVYNFSINNEKTTFSYVMPGEDRYIVFRDEWYEVSNPSDPPVGNSYTQK